MRDIIMYWEIPTVRHGLLVTDKFLWTKCFGTLCNYDKWVRDTFVTDKLWQ